MSLVGDLDPLGDLALSDVLVFIGWQSRSGTFFMQLVAIEETGFLFRYFGRKSTEADRNPVSDSSKILAESHS